MSQVFASYTIQNFPALCRLVQVFSSYTRVIDQHKKPILKDARIAEAFSQDSIWLLTITQDLFVCHGKGEN
jgi:hypothetical protein